MNDMVTLDGEILEATTTSMAVQLQRGEIDQMIATAKAYPRSLQRVKQSILSMATLDEESAEECMYALPRGGKPIKGPSIRFAEVLKQAYGNCRAAARVVHVDKGEGYVEAEGVFHDLETNSASTARVRRRILDKRGKVFTDDMIIVTGNAACSIAMRNAILAGVPKPLWRKAYDTVQATIAGDVTTLAENRTKALKAMAAFGVKPERIFEALGIAGEEEIAVDHIVTLRGMFSALKNGEATVEEMFAGTAKPKSDHETVADPLADHPKPKQTNGAPEASAAEPNDVAAPRESEASETAAPDADEVADGEAPRFDEATRNKLVGYAKDMLRTATSGSADRGETMTKIKDRWKVQLDGAPADALTVAAEIWTVTRSVAKAPDQVEGAITHLAYEIDVDPAMLRAEAA